MIERICGFIHNYFTADEDKYAGTYTIKNGGVELPFLVVGQYFRIFGSALNDGVYLYPVHDLISETFDGVIWAMKVPKALRDIAAEAAELEAANAGKLNGPYTSESVIGVYSYTKGNAASGGVDEWLFGKDGVFGRRLNQWRKLYEPNR